MSFITYFFEFYFDFLYILFLIYFIYLRKFARLLNFLSATIFGLSIEYLSIMFFDAYHYSTKFILQFGKAPNNVPLVIAFCWAMIITSSMSISDHLGLHYYIRPFSDALLALTLDLTMDAIAIRLDGGFWNWGFGLGTTITPITYFGVIWGNFEGWFFIVFIFSYILRIERRIWQDKINWIVIIYNLIVPFLGYLPLYLIFKGTYMLSMFLLSKNILLWHWVYIISLIIISAVIVVTCSFIKLAKNHQLQILKNTRVNLPLILFTSFHLTYLINYFSSGMFKTILLVGIIAFVDLIIFVAVETTITDLKQMIKNLVDDIKKIVSRDKLSNKEAN